MLFWPQQDPSINCLKIHSPYLAVAPDHDAPDVGSMVEDLDHLGPTIWICFKATYVQSKLGVPKNAVCMCSLKIREMESGGLVGREWERIGASQRALEGRRGGKAPSFSARLQLCWVGPATGECANLRPVPCHDPANPGCNRVPRCLSLSLDFKFYLPDRLKYLTLARVLASGK